MSQLVDTHTDRKLVVLTEGHTNPITAKTASSVLRYCADQVQALFDTTEAGKSAGELLDVGAAIPVIGTLDDAPDANTLMIGIAPAGGRIPSAWRTIIFEAIRRKMDVISGLHDFLSDDPEFVSAAEQQGVQLIDVRRNHEHDVANRNGISDQCLRIQTVGNDCCVGKMVATIEMTLALKAQGHDAKFVATGQTGILISGEGCPIDCVVSDFVSGAAEKLIIKNQNHEMLLIEGQGSLAHPRYSAVTLGLLHGCLPHGLVICYEAGREGVHGMEHISLASLSHLKTVYETMANVMHPCRVIGVAMNSRLLSEEAAAVERRRVQDELGVPTCDVFRHGPDDLVRAVLDLQAEVIA
ncbi:MAG: DUF1611 domain-containing protein [Planctomycetaceae bacterium]|nr:DUF1611 domain-containing protein [Planctomycetaceae bacterium]